MGAESEGGRRDGGPAQAAPPEAARSRDRIVIAIDGPAGAGKSTVSRRLAERLGYALLDTGAIYRTVALMARRRGVPLDDGRALAELARSLDIRFSTPLRATPSAGASVGGGDPASEPERQPRVYVGNEDVTRAIRTPEVALGASTVSAFPEVREALLDLQRRLGASGGVVAEGRDVGTVVFPSAEAKFFLTADPAVRARRRAEELRRAGTEVTDERTLLEIERRDREDMTRATAPLRAASDAVVVDSTGLDAEAVVDRMEAVVRERLRSLSGGQER